MSTSIVSVRGADCNRVNVGGVTRLHGDPAVKREKPHTIIIFPGGSVEIARTEDNEYWIHAAVHGSSNTESAGEIVDIRLDADDRYLDASNEVLRSEIRSGGVTHFAVRVRKSAHGGEA